MSLRDKLGNKKSTIAGVDFFCGAGGLTHGLLKARIDVELAVDIDPTCQFPTEKNNSTKFLLSDVSKLRVRDINEKFVGADFSLIAGCAPCQPFSAYSRPKTSKCRHKDWGFLSSFSSLIMKVQPTLVTMENVPPFEKQLIFKEFVGELIEKDYNVNHFIINGADIGLPQRRKRLVLIASKLGNIKLRSKERNQQVIVRDAISNLNPIKAGEHDPKDKLHAAASLSHLNFKRIQHYSKPGGTWRDWPKEYLSQCHLKQSGITFSSVYGRMEWDKPSPTITTQCYGFGNGRFGHPVQDRAISLREVAILQGFPKEYLFIPEEESVNFSLVGLLIGNAIPVTLGEYIGNSIIEHIKSKPI